MAQPTAGRTVCRREPVAADSRRRGGLQRDSVAEAVHGAVSRAERPAARTARRGGPQPRQPSPGAPKRQSRSRTRDLRIHSVAALPLRRDRRGAGRPVNIASALTPNIRWRGHLLLQFEPVEAMRLFHALALPAGVALLLVAPYLAKRRRRAWQPAIVLMARARPVRPAQGPRLRGDVDHLGGRRRAVAAGRVPRPARPDHAALGGLAGAAARRCGAVAGAAVADLGLAGPPVVERRVDARRATCCAGTSGPIHFHHAPFHHRFIWLPLGVHLVELGTLLAIAYVIFRPLAAPRSLPGPAARRQAASELVREHGRDTLSFFKLRADKHYFFSDDRRAFVGYRIENGVLLLSGDPVGPEDAFPGCSPSSGVRRRPRAQARRGRRERGAVPAVRGARAADDLPGRRGGHRPRPLLARGPPDPQGAPVGHAG